MPLEPLEVKSLLVRLSRRGHKHMSSFAQGWMLGKQIMQRQSREEREAELHKLLIQQRKLQLDQAKLEAAARPFKAQFEAFRSGMAPMTATATMPSGAPVPTEAEAVPELRGALLETRRFRGPEGEMGAMSTRFGLPEARLAAGLERGPQIEVPPELASLFPGGMMDVAQALRQQRAMQLQAQREKSQLELDQFAKQKEIEKKFKPPQIQFASPGTQPFKEGEKFGEPIPAKPPDLTLEETYVDNAIKLHESKLRRKLTLEEQQAVRESSRRRYTSLDDRAIDNELLGIKKELATIQLEQARRGKPLSDTAIEKISSSEAAISSLKDLRTVLSTNEEYIGPIAGFQAVNPYSEARKAQADIDRVRQRVGKALEGGVLRKEDENKYKVILATLRDTPSTAIHKVDGIIAEIQRDIDTYKNLQSQSGRFVPGITQKLAPTLQKTAVNPKTGERLELKGGKWVPIPR